MRRPCRSERLLACKCRPVFTAPVRPGLQPRAGAGKQQQAPPGRTKQRENPQQRLLGSSMKYCIHVVAIQYTCISRNKTTDRSVHSGYSQPSSPPPAAPAFAPQPWSTSFPFLTPCTHARLHAPDRTTPTRPLPSPPKAKAKKIFQIRATTPVSLSLSLLHHNLSSHLCLRATHRRLSNPNLFLGHEATLIKLLLIAPEFNFSNLHPSTSNVPPQVQVRTSYST